LQVPEIKRALGARQFTVLAPSDAAFEAFKLEYPSAYDALFKSTGYAASILQCKSYFKAHLKIISF
jgi:hypothetical protein